jgi:hypothetical protein
MSLAQVLLQGFHVGATCLTLFQSRGLLSLLNIPRFPTQKSIYKKCQHQRRTVVRFLSKVKVIPSAYLLNQIIIRSKRTVVRFQSSHNFCVIVRFD